jgi:hypothetical protein
VTADTLRALSILLKELLRSSGSRTFTRVGGGEEEEEEEEDKREECRKEKMDGEEKE